MRGITRKDGVPSISPRGKNTPQDDSQRARSIQWLGGQPGVESQKSENQDGYPALANPPSHGDSTIPQKPNNEGKTSITTRKGYVKEFRNTTRSQKRAALQKLDGQIDNLNLNLEQNTEKKEDMHQICRLMLKLSVTNSEDELTKINELVNNNTWLQQPNIDINDILKLTYRRTTIFCFSRRSAPDALLIFCRMVGYDYKNDSSLHKDIKNIIDNRSLSYKKLEKRHSNFLNNLKTYEMAQILSIVIPADETSISQELQKSTPEKINDLLASSTLKLEDKEKIQNLSTPNASSQPDKDKEAIFQKFANDIVINTKETLTTLYNGLNVKERKLVSAYLDSIRKGKKPGCLIPLLQRIQPPTESDKVVTINKKQKELHEMAGNIDNYKELAMAFSIEYGGSDPSKQPGSDVMNNLFKYIGLNDKDELYIINPLVTILLCSALYPNGKNAKNTEYIAGKFIQEVQEELTQYNKYKDKQTKMIDFYNAFKGKLGITGNTNSIVRFEETRNNNLLQVGLNSMLN